MGVESVAAGCSVGTASSSISGLLSAQTQAAPIDPADKSHLAHSRGCYGCKANATSLLFLAPTWCTAKYLYLTGILTRNVAQWLSHISGTYSALDAFLNRSACTHADFSAVYPKEPNDYAKENDGDLNTFPTFLGDSTWVTHEPRLRKSLQSVYSVVVNHIITKGVHMLCGLVWF